MKYIEAKSAGAQIQIVGIGDGTPMMLAAKCPPGYYYSYGDSSTALSKVDFSYADLNLRGFDGSRVENVQTANYGLAEYMADFDAAIAKLQAKQPVLFGYSHGGYFTTSYAIANPDKVKALILVEPALFTDPADLEARAKLAEAGDGAGAIKAMLRYVDPTTGLNRVAAENTAEAIMSHVQHPRILALEFRIRAANQIKEQALKSLQMPVLLIGGTDSHVRDMVERAAGLIPNSSCWWVRGANHLTIMEKKYATELSTMVNLFVSRL